MTTISNERLNRALLGAPYLDYAEQAEVVAELLALREAHDICQGTVTAKLDDQPLPGNYLDGTDFACPGWWRGHDNGSEGMARLVKKLRVENRALRKQMEESMRPEEVRERAEELRTLAARFFSNRRKPDRAPWGKCCPGCYFENPKHGTGPARSCDARRIDGRAVHVWAPDIPTSPDCKGVPDRRKPKREHVARGPERRMEV